MTINQLAARHVARVATDPADARMLLDILGLLTDDGRIAPDDTRALPLEVPSAAVAAHAPTSVRWWTDKPVVSTAPEALRNLPPVRVEPVKRPLSPSQIAGPPRPAMKPCGTEAAAKRHVRDREPLCEACVAGRAARNKNLQKKPEHNRGTTHGTASGNLWHYRHGEKPCTPCREAASKARREIRARKAAA